MNSFLKDFETKEFGSEQEVHDFIESRENNDIWYEPYINELAVIGIPMEAPILITALKTQIQNLKATDDQLLETMQPEYGTMGLLLQSPDPQGNSSRVMPMRYTAISPLLERAGIGGRSIRNVDEKMYVNVLEPEEKGKIISKCLSLYSAPCKILFRDGKIGTVRSNKYEILKTSELLNELELTISSEWMNYMFVTASVNHEYISVRYKIHDSSVEKKLAGYLANTSLGSYIPEIGFEFMTSDVGNSTAKVVSLLYCCDSNGSIQKIVPMGLEVGMKHSTGSSMDKWITEILPKLGLLVQDMTEKLKELVNIEIKNPGSCLRKFCYELKLPKISALEVAEEMDNSFFTCTALDIYSHLHYVVEKEEKKRPNGFTPSAKLRYLDSAASAIYMDFKDRDCEFNWD